MRRTVVIGALALLAALGAASLEATEGVGLRPLPPVYLGSEDDPIRSPEGVGCGSTTLVVADSGNGRLLLYTFAADSLTPAGAVVSPQLPFPIHAEIASNGEIFALDGKLRKIARFDDSGRFRDYVAPGGETDSMVPRSFKLGPGDDLFVLDLLSRRVRVMSAEGEVRREIAFPAGSGFFSDLVVDRTGKLYAVDSVGKRLFTASPGDAALAPLTETLEAKADFHTGITTDGTGNLYVVDQNGGSILVLGPDGSFRARRSGLGWTVGMLRYPSKLCVDPYDHLFVADRANHRVQVFAIVR
jgi:DNA-binding beta-propeller fold protein YncE